LVQNTQQNSAEMAHLRGGRNGGNATDERNAMNEPRADELRR